MLTQSSEITRRTATIQDRQLDNAIRDIANLIGEVNDIAAPVNQHIANTDLTISTLGVRELTMAGPAATDIFQIAASGGTPIFGAYGDNKIKISDAYFLPTADGAADQFVKTDGAGNLSFSAISADNIGTSDLTINSAGVRKLILGGSLSTDSFVIRNSADTGDYLTVTGDGQVYAQGAELIDSNTTFGKEALSVGVVTGLYNTAFGRSSLKVITSGNKNTGIGYAALSSTNTGAQNTAVGFNAATFANKTNVTAIGSQALALAGGDNSVVIGVNALYNHGGVGNHVVIGNTAGAKGTTAVGNTTIGYNAHTSGADSDYCAILGYNALSNAVGDNNVSVGKSAGFYYGTGSNVCTAAAETILIGRDARPKANTETNQIVIGDSGRGNGSNTTTIGNSSTVGTFLKGAVVMGEYTVATLPTASTYQAGMIAVSDETGGYTMAFSDGTNWRRVQDRAIVS